MFVPSVYTVSGGQGLWAPNVWLGGVFRHIAIAVAMRWTPSDGLFPSRSASLCSLVLSPTFLSTAADPRYNRWERDHVLSFIPPDGKFKLLEYEAATSPKMPFVLKAGMQLDDAGGRFSLTLTPRVARLEDISISIFLGSSTTGISATPAGDRKPPGQAAQEGAADGHVGGGTCEFDPHTQVLRWTLSSLVQHERSPTLTGSFVS